MLPARLPDELDFPAINGYYSGEEYGIVFPYGPTETVAEVSNAETLGTLRAYPEDEDVANEFFDAERIEEVVLPDGTEATLRYMVPAGRSGSQGPFWEGKFDKDGYTYNLTVIKPKEITEDQVRLALSTMVLVRGSEGEPTTGEYTQPTTPSTVPPQSTTPRLRPKHRGDGSRGTSGGGGILPGRGMEDWDYTYDHLDAETKSRFTREEWFKKNQFFADNGEVIYHIESVERLGTSSGFVVGVSLRLTYEDGSSSTRNTYFVYEDGEWKHAFGREEYDLFMPAVPYEEFVKAQ